jgi:hypothetical protein
MTMLGPSGIGRSVFREFILSGRKEVAAVYEEASMSMEFHIL